MGEWKTEEQRTAYHESGHAIADILLRKRFRKISIIEDEDSAGRVEGKVFPPRYDPFHQIFFAHIPKKVCSVSKPVRQI